MPEWEAAEPQIRWSLEPTDMPLEDALHDRVSDQLAQVLVHVSADETDFSGISPSNQGRQPACRPLHRQFLLTVAVAGGCVMCGRS
jgi:hypothetical protein